MRCYKAAAKARDYNLFETHRKQQLRQPWPDHHEDSLMSTETQDLMTKKMQMHIL